MSSTKKHMWPTSDKDIVVRSLLLLAKGNTELAAEAVASCDSMECAVKYVIERTKNTK